MKKTLATIMLAATMLFGATFANAGIIITDRTDSAQTDVARDGIIVFGSTVASLAGIIVF